MRDFAYLRVSTDRQDAEHQRESVVALAPDSAEVLKDSGSAWSDNLAQRPAFREIREAVVQGRASSITVWDLDRLYRNRVAAVEFLRLCYAQDVAVRSVRQQFLQAIERIPAPWNEIVRDLLVQVLAWIAEEESNKRSERVKAAYRNHERDDWGRPGIDPDVQREVLELRNQGNSYRSIRQAMGDRAPSLGKISEICKKAKR